MNFFLLFLIKRGWGGSYWWVGFEHWAWSVSPTRPGLRCVGVNELWSLSEKLVIVIKTSKTRPQTANPLESPRNGGLFLLPAPRPQTLASRTDSRIPNPAICLHRRAPIPVRSRCGRRRRNQRKRSRCRSNSRCITRRMSPSLASSWRSGGRWCRSRTGSRRTTTSPSPKPTAASAPPRSQSGPSRTSRTSSNYILFWNPFHENPRLPPPSLSLMVLKCPSWSYRLMVFVSCQADALFWRGRFI